MFFVILTLAGILFLVANLALRFTIMPLRITGIAGVGLSVLPLFLMFFTLVVPLQFLLLFAVMPFCLGAPKRSDRFLVLSIVATVVAFAPFVINVLVEQIEYSAMRKQFPYEAMQERVPPNSPLPAGELPTAGLQSLTNIENIIDRDIYSRRNDMLKRLHEDATNLFVNNPGFGSGRMMGFSIPSKNGLTTGLRDSTPIPQPGSSLPVPRSIDQRQSETRMTVPSGIGDLHESSIVDFVHPKGFGYFKDRAHVAGFQAHGFSQVPTEKQIEVETIELVGLLHGEPRVYLSPNLPRMDELKTAPTRSLDAFEKSGVASLRTGEDLFTLPESGSIRMLGAIRSTKQCIACHRGLRGDLLGAFSYVLRAKAQ